MLTRGPTFKATLLLLLAFAIVVAARATDAQRAGRVQRIGVLVGGRDAGPWFSHFRAGLRELGYTEGNDLLAEYRFSEGKTDRLPQIAADLVRMKVAVIVAVFASPARAAHQATRSIPIVGIGVGGPVGIGLAASVARPGGNVTETASYLPELGGKPLELLKEVIPDLKRVGVLWNPSNPTHTPFLKDVARVRSPRPVNVDGEGVAQGVDTEGDLEVHHLAHPQGGGVGGGEQEAIADARAGVEQAPDLLAAEDLGELLGLPGAGTTKCARSWPGGDVVEEARKAWAPWLHVLQDSLRRGCAELEAEAQTGRSIDCGRW